MYTDSINPLMQSVIGTANGRPLNAKPTVLPGSSGTSGTTAPAPTATGSVPAGFTPEQWAKLQKLAIKNPTIADLIKKYQAGLAQTTADASWRRTLPANTTDLLKQLSYNAGEQLMPGGYVGAVQLPAFGSSAQPVNNPDMTKYGQAPGIGEATFYAQSMKGGMAPIAASGTLGVPADWKPGTDDLKSKLDEYLKNLGKGGGGGGGKQLSMKQQMQQSLDAWIKQSLNGGFQGIPNFFPTGGMGRRPAGGGAGNKPGNGGGTFTNYPGTEHPAETTTDPLAGVWR